MSEHTEYQQKLAETIAAGIRGHDLCGPKPLSHTVAAVLAAEEVVDPDDQFDRFRAVLTQRDVAEREIERLKAMTGKVPPATVLEIRNRYKHVMDKPTIVDFNRVLCDVVLAINDRDEGRTEIERLEAEALLHRTFGIDQRKAGMEQAAKIVKHMSERTQPAHDIVLLNEVVAAIRAEIKREAGSREAEFPANEAETSGSASRTSCACPWRGDGTQIHFSYCPSASRTSTGDSDAVS